VIFRASQLTFTRRGPIKASTLIARLMSRSAKLRRSKKEVVWDRQRYRI